MIRVQTILRCDACKVAFPTIVDSYSPTSLTATVEALRERAAKKNWGRYRSTPAGPIGDYRPDCKSAPKKARKGAAT